MKGSVMDDQQTITPEQAKTRWYAQQLAATLDREADLTVALMQARQDLAQARAGLHNAATGTPDDVEEPVDTHQHHPSGAA